MNISRILFNYDTMNETLPNVPINLRRGPSTEDYFELPEYELSKYKNNPICYVSDNTNTDLIVKVTFFDKTSSLNGSIKIKGVTSIEDILGNTEEKTVTFSNGISLGDYVDFQLSSNHIAQFKIGKFICEWSWQYYNESIYKWIEFTTTKHLVYVIPHRPLTSLWTLKNFESMYVPWASALDYICDALNKIDCTKTDDDIRKMVALWVNGRAVEYDTINGAPAYSRIIPDRITLKPAFNPSLFIKDIKKASETNKLKINCNDCATINSFFLSLLGIENEISYLSNDMNFSVGFTCNPLKAIGHDEWKVPFNGGFSYHAVCSSNAGTFITDSCVQIDSGTDPCETMPPTGTIKIGKIACGVPFSKPLSSPPCFEDCYKERLCKPNSLGNCNVVSYGKSMEFFSDGIIFMMENISFKHKELKLAFENKKEKSTPFLFQAEKIKFSNKFQYKQRNSHKDKIYTSYDIFCKETNAQYSCEFYFCKDFEQALGCADNLIFESVVMYEKTNKFHNYLDIGFVSVINKSIIGVKENLAFRFTCSQLNNNTIIKFSELFLSNLQ